MTFAPSASPLRVAATLLLALAGAGAALWLHLPLPWFTGPLLAVATVSMAGGRVAGPPHARDLGQWLVGTALGLYFSPEVVREIGRLAPWIALSTLFMIALGLIGAPLLRRLSGESGSTVFFASAIGGAPEMAAQAERYQADGARVDRVAASHSLRLMLVSLIVPFALQWAGVQGAAPYASAARDAPPSAGHWPAMPHRARWCPCRSATPAPSRARNAARLDTTRDDRETGADWPPPPAARWPRRPSPA